MASRLHESEPREEKAGKAQEKRTAFSKFRTVAAATALLIGACTYEGAGINPTDGTGGAADTAGSGGDGGTITDGGVEAGKDAGHEGGTGGDGGMGGMDAGTTDAGTGGDGGMGGDGGSMSDGGPTDGGMEGGVDGGMDGGPVDGGPMDGGGGMDGGISDGGMEGGADGGGMDGGTDAGIVCSGVFSDSRMGLWPVGVDVAVGGYNFRYNGQIAGGVQYDIRCVSGGALLESNHPFMQAMEGSVLRPQDTAVSVTGMRIRLLNNLSGPASANSNVVVEPAP
jgi:hypothetical protein